MQTLVILSEADGSRSEPSEKSKDPIRAGAATSFARNFYHFPATGHWPLTTGH